MSHCSAKAARHLGDLSVTNSFAGLPGDFYTRVATRPLKAPRVLHANPAAAELIGLDPEAFAHPEFLDVVSGTTPLIGGQTLAAVYSGHQFGVWAGQLGDGRAHLLGEVCGPAGAWELQLKGGGMTPYSRMGDGRAVLRSSVREYLASEAMHGLGIPTTRALALVSADDPVIRETVETAAVVTRMAPSFVRFGSFEHWAANRRPDHLRTLADYVIDRFYPECRAAAGIHRASNPTGAFVTEGSGGAEGAKPVSGFASGDPYVNLVQAVTERTAELMAAWQVVGFCHGVMNTDNMSILGLTLDYGPYGFMDGFDARHICNHTDANGRYAWHAQPSVAQWNLIRLASSLRELVADDDALRAALGRFEPVLLDAMQRRMMAKLGFADWRAGDEQLVDDLWRLMHENHADFTLTFRQLAHAPGLTDAAPERVREDLGGTVGPTLTPFLDLFTNRDAASAWLKRYRERTLAEGRPWQTRTEGMLAVNPLYVLRNYLAQQAIEAAKAGDASEIDRLMQLLAHPCKAQPGMERYAAQPPAWANGIEVSCSS